MKFLKFLIIIFISLTTSIKADLNKNLMNQLESGGKLIFIRHAYAPGSGDPNNFNLNDCSTQRNLNEDGINQAKNIGKFFKKNKSKQVKELSNYVQNFNSKKNLILITHYVLIYEILGYAPSSGEIVISDRNFNIVGSVKIDY